MSAIGPVPPNDLKAEQAVLGAMLLDREAVAQVATLLRPEDFYTEKHRIIFRAILHLFARGEPIDLVTVPRRLTDQEQIEQAGGHTYIAALLNVCATAAAAEHYAGLVLETATRRALIIAGEQIVSLGHDRADEIEDAIAGAERLVLDIRSRRGTDSLVLAPQIVQAALEHAEAAMRLKPGQVPGVPYPPTLSALDEATAGQQAGEVIAVQAITGVGKSAFITQCGAHAAGTRGGALLCANEMGHPDYGLRLLAAAANVDALILRRGRMTDEERQRLLRAAGPLADLPFAIDDHCFTFLDIRAAAHRAQAKFANRGGLRWLGVDWLQLLAYGAGKFENRTQELDAIMRGLKQLAADLAVPVMIGSQPDKASYGAKLSLASGRGTGFIAMVAHTILSIEPWNADGRPVPLGHPGWPVKIRVEKARMGQGNGQVEQECWFDAPRTQFVALDAWIRQHAHGVPAAGREESRSS